MSEYIHRGRLYNAVFLASRLRKNDLLDLIDNAPTVDAVEVVRCKDCIHSDPINTELAPFRFFRKECVLCNCEVVVGDDPMVYLPDHFCSYGKRRSDNAAD